MSKWLVTLLHILVIAGGVAGTVLGHPQAGVIAGTINALLPSPIGGKLVNTDSQ